MKDLLEIILKNLANYLPVFVSVIGTPKRAVIKLIDNTDDRLNKALLFVGITIAIGFAFQAPLLQKDEDFAAIAGSMVAFKFFAITAFSGVILSAFWLVGGKGNYEATLCAYLYIISPLYLFLLFLHMIFNGIISVHDLDLATRWRSGQSLTVEQFQKLNSVSPLTAIVYYFSGFFQLLVVIVWFGICWGGFRSIHQVSLIRSILAFLMTMTILFTFLHVTTIVIWGLYGGRFPKLQ